MEPVEQTGPESVVFRVHRAGNPPECLPTAYKPQLITRRSLVQVQPPQPNKKGTQTGAFFIWFELASDGSQPPAGGTSASLKCGRNLRFPHKRPLPGTCSLFSFHFARQGHINQGIPLSFCGSPENRPPQARQRTAPRRGQAEPGRNSAHMDFLNASALCTRSGSDNKYPPAKRGVFPFRA